MQEVDREWRPHSGGDSTARISCTCGQCQSCVFTANLSRSTQWLLTAGQAARRSFLSGIILRCRSAEILENVHNVLQVTLGKDFTYARSRVKAVSQEEVRNSGSGEGVHAKLVGVDMVDTWEWFSASPSWTKSNYLLGLLSQCDPELLHRLGNLVRVLIAREKRGFLQFSSGCCAHGDHPDLTSSIYKADYECFPHKTQDDCTEILHRSEPTKHAIWSEMEEVAFRGWRGKDSDAHSDSSEDPALMVVPRSSKSMSGVSIYRDFIRRLPVDISKRILGLLDAATLQHCKHVSQHWLYLTEEILNENEVKKMVENQAMVLQGSSSSGVNPVYARIRQVLVPLREEEKFIHPLTITPKNKKDVWDFESVYIDVQTKTVEMEERNVYCGVFNILVLLDREDPSRVIHYSGGQMVAVGSKDRTVHLLDVTLLKKVPVLMQGHAGSVRAVLVCEERDLVISASYDLSIRCWNLKTGVCTSLLWGHMGTISCLDLHADLLVSGARDCRVKVWNLQTGQCCERLRFRHHKPVVCVKISASLVLSGCEEGLVKLWGMETATLLKVVDGHQGCVKCLCMDQWHILSGGSDGQVLAWSTNPDFTKSLITFHHPKEVLTLSFLFLRVITGCVDGKIRIFNFLSGDCLRVIKISTHQSPILSLHAHGNSILVNSSSRVLLLRFSQERWDYSALSERRSGSVFHATLNHAVGAELKAHSGSSKPRIWRRDGRARARVLAHHTRSLSAPSMQRAHAVQLDSTRPATWSELQDQQTSSLSQSRPISGHSRDGHRRACDTPWSTVAGSEKLYEEHVMTRSERAVRELVKKRGMHRPMTAPQMLLKVRPTQQPHTCDLAVTNMNLNAAVRDAWGPPPSGSEQQTKTSHPPPPPKRPHSTPKPHTKGFRGTVKIYTPLRHVDASTSSPTLIRPQTGLGIYEPLFHPKPKSRHPQSACGVRKVIALTTTAEEDIQNCQKMFMRNTGKHPRRRVDFDLPSKPKTVDSPLDPFRERGGFQLKTDTELEELIRAQAQLHHMHTHNAGDNDRQRKIAWKLKIKGVPPNECTKEDQLYASE